jgi:microcompartment protein CcmL/EutN
MPLDRIQPSVAPIGDVTGAAGYAVPTATTDGAKAAVEAGKYLSDPLVLSRLTDRVYELFLEDLRCQRERVINYGKGR